MLRAVSLGLHKANYELAGLGRKRGKTSPSLCRPPVPPLSVTTSARDCRVAFVWSFICKDQFRRRTTSPQRITMCSPSAYSVPREAEALFQQGILENPLMQYLPASLKELSRFVRFEGNALPSIPVNWRWAESISALKALEATMLNYLLILKYKISPVEVTINTYVRSLGKIYIRKY